MVASGSALVAWREDLGAQQVLFADADAGWRSAGLLVLRDGSLLDLPGAGAPQRVRLHTFVPPANWTGTLSEAATLSPWFNKL